MRPLLFACKSLGIGLLGVLLSLSLALPLTWAAQPVITVFESDADLDADGTLRVTETITATLPGGGHGMFREIPYAVKLPSGQVLRIPPTVREVLLDGKAMPVTDTEKRPNDVLRIYMRDTARQLEEGQHVFTLSYSMSHMVGYFEKHDELNWNVTGDLWAVPIEKALLSLALPPGARIDKTAAWVGVRGSKNSEDVYIRRAEVSSFPGVQFMTLRPLEAGEGFTCAVSWNKGIVAQPAAPLSSGLAAEEGAGASPQNMGQSTGQSGGQSGASTAALALAALVWGYFALAWWKVGRDPAKGVIIPLFHPPAAPASFGLPQGTPLSPAAVNYMVNATVLEPRGLAALLLSLVTRSNCAIFGDAGAGFRVQCTGKDDSPYAEERAAYACIAAAGSVPLSKDGAEPIAVMLKEVRELLHKGSPAAWSLNGGWTAVGILLALVGIFACLCLRFGLPDQWGSLVQAQLLVAVVALVVLPGLLVLTVQLLRQGRVMVALLLVGMAGGGVVAMLDVALPALTVWLESPLLTGGLFATVLAPCVFGPLMKAPSAEARKLLDACEGLALYIKTAESNRLAQFNPPARTPELYARLMPYAVALNLEKAWGEHCAEALAASQLSEPYDTARNLHQFPHAGLTTAVVSGTAAAYAAYEASQTSALDDKDSGGSGSGGGGGGGGFC